MILESMQQIQKLEMQRCLAIWAGNYRLERALFTKIQCLREEREQLLAGLVDQLWPGAIMPAGE